MQNGMRFFAYATWVVMLSGAIILISNPFLSFINDPSWVGLVALLALGLLYLNLSYASVKRYIIKISSPTYLHYALAFLIYLPASFWIYFASETIEGSRLITLVVLAFAICLGAVYGQKNGMRARYRYLEEQNKKG